MSCGLGAIMLVFLLVKHNVDNSVFETDLLKADLQRLQQLERELQDEIADTLAGKEKTLEQIAIVSHKINRTKADLTRTKSESSKKEHKRSALEETIKKIKIPQEPDIIEDLQVGEENYLIGLRVKGRRIGILVDSSASMTDETLIDIIRRKNSSAVQKKAGLKWQRTKRIVKWLLARVPETSEVSVLTFSGKADYLGGNTWKSGNDGSALRRILNDLDAIVPEGSTNLQAGLEAIAVQRPTDLYLVTDGLPTDGDSGYRSLNPFASCSALWGASSKISGECRVELFRHTIDTASLPGVTVNVILLPIAGDPQASSEFWQWTSKTRGLIISPAVSWP